jgi:phosphatidylserine/phosphatidylglycerophosphate/cardiolipin synthase-like enzyme
MHHKIIIIDHSIVVTGSYNFTGSADDRNDENAVIFFSPDIAEFFFAEFERVFGMAQRP